jgi:hypothetical protein
MKQPILALISSLAASLALPLDYAAAADDSAPSGDLVPMGSADQNRFGLSYRMGLNISAQFRNLGGYTAQGIGAGAYDNGFVYPDDTTATAHPGYTWNYGYAANTPQRPADAPTDFDLYRSSAPANLTSRDNTGDPQHGLELTYNRKLGKLGHGFWGIEAGLSFTDVTINDNQTLLGTVERQTDTYQTGGGAILKPAPFAGTAAGPSANDSSGWPLVGISPVSSAFDIFPGAATVTGNREFDAHILSLRFGPYFELPLNKRWTFELSGGVVLSYINSEFKYNETVSLDQSVTLVSLPNQTSSGSGTHDDWLVGAYVGGTFSYSITEHLRAFAGAQWQYSGDYSQTVAGQQAILNLGASVFVPIGISYSF